MRINNINNTNFKALLGKKEVTYFNKDNKTCITIVQSIHPFRDEFQSRKQASEALDEFRKSDFFARQNDITENSIKIYDAKLECPLPFTKEEYLEIKKHPEQNRNANSYFTDGDFNCTVFRDKISTPIYLEQGELIFK